MLLEQLQEMDYGQPVLLPSKGREVALYFGLNNKDNMQKNCN